MHIYVYMCMSSKFDSTHLYAQNIQHSYTHTYHVRICVHAYLPTQLETLINKHADGHADVHTDMHRCMPAPNNSKPENVGSPEPAGRGTPAEGQ